MLRIYYNAGGPGGGGVLGVFAKWGCWGRSLLLQGCGATAGNNKLIPHWPINSSVGYAIHEWHMLVENTLKCPLFVKGIGSIREFDLFVGGPEQLTFLKCFLIAQ